MRYGLRSFVLVLAAATGVDAGDTKDIHGRVVDDAGRPVAGLVVAPYWRANGAGKGPGGRTLDMTKEEDVKALWSHVGEMEPGSESTTTGPDGRFSLTMSWIFHAVMAQDGSRKRGGLVVIPKGRESEELEIHLGPLVKVRGSIRGPGPGVRPSWTHVYTLLPEEPTRPIDSDRLVGCGSHDARFEMSLPPGRYFLHAYNDSGDARTVPDKPIDLTADVPEVDLGILTLSPVADVKEATMDRARVDGTWGDYTKHFGQQPPPWNVTDALSASKDIRLSDFRGRWVLLYFWGFDCRPCLGKGLPALAKFQEEHATRRDRFEILSVCFDFGGELKSIADVERRMKPIVEHVWGGKLLPFPVLLDATDRTWVRYGLQYYGSTLLIDPEGRLVEGDEATLAEKLR